MICYAIKRDDGRYAHSYYIYEDENWAFYELNMATIFDTFEEAEEKSKYINTYYKAQTKVVKVEIKEVEE